MLQRKTTGTARQKNAGKAMANADRCTKRGESLGKKGMEIEEKERKTRINQGGNLYASWGGFGTERG